MKKKDDQRSVGSSTGVHMCSPLGVEHARPDVTSHLRSVTSHHRQGGDVAMHLVGVLGLLDAVRGPTSRANEFIGLSLSTTYQHAVAVPRCTIYSDIKIMIKLGTEKKHPSFAPD